MYEQIIIAIAAAIIYGLAGYFKSSGETFDKEKFLTTVVIGLVVGIIQVYVGVSYEAAYTLALSVGIIAMVENIMKAIYRHIFVQSVAR